MQIWEYKVVPIIPAVLSGHYPNSADHIEKFSEYGKDGWELVTVTWAASDRHFAFFKRPLE